VCRSREHRPTATRLIPGRLASDRSAARGGQVDRPNTRRPPALAAVCSWDAVAVQLVRDGGERHPALMSPPDPGTDPRGKLRWASEPNTLLPLLLERLARPLADQPPLELGKGRNNVRNDFTDRRARINWAIERPEPNPASARGSDGGFPFRPLRASEHRAARQLSGLKRSNQGCRSERPR
jgi:hypothetical protein